MSIPLEKLLEQIPSDTEDKVRRAKDRFNQQIREALRQESALRLRRDETDDGLNPRKREALAVRVSLVPGLPAALRAKAIDEKDWLAALLAPWRYTLEQLRDSSTHAQRLVTTLLADPRASSVVKGRDVHLPPVFALADDLLKEVQRFNLARWILEVDEDVLGIYRHQAPSNLFEDPAAAHVELYWAVIGLVAKAEAVSVDPMTLVVFAHELAHAYTHLGSDIDGKRWATKDFAASDHPLKEGLAQYYTALVCDRLATQEANAPAAYRKLLKDQPAAYHTHENWLKEFTPEEVRLAVIEARRKGPGKVTEFDKSLVGARSRLRKGVT